MPKAGLDPTGIGHSACHSGRQHAVAAVERSLGNRIQQAECRHHGACGQHLDFEVPPVMSFTLLAKSRAYSWKMSLVGQVLCHRIEIGPGPSRLSGTPWSPLHRLLPGLLKPGTYGEIVLFPDWSSSGW